MVSDFWGRLLKMRDLGPHFLARVWKLLATPKYNDNNKSADPFGVTRRMAAMLPHCGRKEIETSPLSPPAVVRQNYGQGRRGGRGVSQTTVGGNSDS